MQFDSDKQKLEKKSTYVDERIPDASGFVRKTDHNTIIDEIKNKILGASGLFIKTDYDAKIAEIEHKITDVTNLVKKLIIIQNYIALVIG